MAFTHFRWDKSGQTLRDVGTGQRMYKGTLGEQQTWDGLKWLPYLWKAGSNELQYGHNENNLEFASDRQILKVAAKIICSSMKVFVQAYVAGQWVDQPHGVPTRNIAYDYPVEGRCTGYLDFPDAYLSFGAQLPYELQVGLEVGRSGKAIFGCRVRAPVSGQIRIQLVLDELANLPTDWEWIWATYDPSKGKEDRRIGIRFKDLEWRWTYDEAPLRAITVETNPDTTKKVTVTMGPFDYISDIWLIVYPDTWGETVMAHDYDDCEDSASNGLDLNGLDSDGDVIGNVYVGVSDYYCRWQNVVIAANPTSVDIGTQIEYDIGWAGGGTFTIAFYGLEGDTPDFNATDPSGATLTTASATKTSEGTGTRLIDGSSFQAVVKEVLDTSWSSGYDIAFKFDDNGCPSGRGIQIKDYYYDTAGAARITIVYTPAAAGADVNFFSQANNVFNPGAIILKGLFNINSSIAGAFITSGITLVAGGIGYAWGEQNPTGEIASAWSNWSDGAGGSPDILDGDSWGKLALQSGEVAHSPVVNTGNVDSKSIELTNDKYGAGAGVVTLYIRGQAASFGQDAGTPSWESYGGQINKVWQYIQVRAVG